MIYNILDFGAEISDRLQTEKIQSAIDKCFLDGGGKLVLEFENVDITADENVEDVPFAHLKYFKKLFFNNVTAKDFKSFDIRKDLGDEDGEIIIENSSPFSVISGV